MDNVNLRTYNLELQRRLIALNCLIDPVGLVAQACIGDLPLPHTLKHMLWHGRKRRRTALTSVLNISGRHSSWGTRRCGCKNSRSIDDGKRGGANHLDGRRRAERGLVWSAEEQAAKARCAAGISDGDRHSIRRVKGHSMQAVAGAWPTHAIPIIAREPGAVPTAHQVLGMPA